MQITEEVGRISKDLLELRAQMTRVESLLANLSRQSPTIREVYIRASMCGLIGGGIPVIIAALLKAI